MKRMVSLFIISSLLLVSCSKYFDAPNNTAPSTTTEVITVIESTVVDESTTTTTQEESSAQETIDSSTTDTETQETVESSVSPEITVDTDSFISLADPNLHRYTEDHVLAVLDEELDSDDYEVLDVNAIYISQEFIDELEYNSQRNNYFGYTDDEIQEQYGDVPYIFTLGPDGTTIVQPIEPSEDHFDETVRNVAIGTGVILVCVTVSVIAGATGATVVSIIFATAAARATEYALLSSAISGISAGIITGYQTGDYQEAIEAGTVAASEGFKWGAISGAVLGGIEGGISAFTYNPALLDPMDPNYPADPSFYDYPNWYTFDGEIPNYTQSETDILASLGLTDDAAQISFIDGEIVPYGTPGSTRPDIVIENLDGTVHAIEIKNYDLETDLPGLRNVLRRQISQRTVDLPSGSTQEIIFDIRGREYSPEFLESVQTYLSDALSEIYPNIPITFFGG